MNKKMRELLTKMEEKTKEANSIMAAEGEQKDVAKVNALMDEVDALKEEYKAEERLFDAAKLFESPEVKKAADDKKKLNAIEEFAKAVRDLAKGMVVEGTDADGGYAVPEDIQTRVIEHKDAMVDLKKFVTVESVSTLSGARTYQKIEDVEGFATVAEAQTIPELANPHFDRIEYVIEKYAGFLPVSNEVLNDANPTRIADVVAKWFAKNSVATTNRLIVAAINTKDAVDLKDLDGIRKAVTVTLGQAYKHSAILLTNDDGLNYLDTLKDANQRPLLNPDPTTPNRWTLRMGNVMVPVETVPNKTMKTNEGKIPFVVGDLKEGIVCFDRESLSILASTTATVGNVSAFGQDLTLFRGIERLDVVVSDDNAFVNGYIVPAAE